MENSFFFFETAPRGVKKVSRGFHESLRGISSKFQGCLTTIFLVFGLVLGLIHGVTEIELLLWGFGGFDLEFFSCDVF